MELNEIIAQLNPIFRDVLDNDAISISPETKADDIEEWDSLNHIQLVVAIEKHFKVRFTAAEINGWKNVGDMCKAIVQRTQQ
jgi:acyl carrier protein